MRAGHGTMQARLGAIRVENHAVGTLMDAHASRSPSQSENSGVATNRRASSVSRACIPARHSSSEISVTPASRSQSRRVRPPFSCIAARITETSSSRSSSRGRHGPSRRNRHIYEVVGIELFRSHRQSWRCRCREARREDAHGSRRSVRRCRGGRDGRRPVPSLHAGLHR